MAPLWGPPSAGRPEPSLQEASHPTKLAKESQRTPSADRPRPCSQGKASRARAPPTTSSASPAHAPRCPPCHRAARVGGSVSPRPTGPAAPVGSSGPSRSTCARPAAAAAPPCEREGRRRRLRAAQRRRHGSPAPPAARTRVRGHAKLLGGLLQQARSQAGAPTTARRTCKGRGPCPGSPPAKVVERVIGHVDQLVRLTQAVPGAVVTGVDVNSMPVSLCAQTGGAWEGRGQGWQARRMWHVRCMCRSSPPPSKGRRRLARAGRRGLRPANSAHAACAVNVARLGPVPSSAPVLARQQATGPRLRTHRWRPAGFSAPHTRGPSGSRQTGSRA